MADADFLSMVLPHMTYLCDNLDLGWRLVNALCDVGLLTWHSRGDMMNQKESRIIRIKRLLTEILPYQGSGVSNSFVEALQASGQEHVVTRLREATYRQEAHRLGQYNGSEHTTRGASENELLQKELSDDCILYIGQHIGKWKLLARSLGFSEGQIENLEEDHYKNQEEQGIQMLHKWVKKESKDATVGKLVAAARQVGKGDVAQLLLLYVKDHEHV